VRGGLVNFRPLPALSLREPPRRRVFRSASLDGLSPALLRRLTEQLAIGTYVDLHGDEGCSGDAGSTPGPRRVRAPVRSTARSPNGAVPTAADYADYYAAILEDCGGALAAAFQAVAVAAPTGVVFACQQGKDRTGLVAAALLEAAGVPREAILRDYGRSGPALARAAERQRASWEKRGFTRDAYLNRYRLGHAPLALFLDRLGPASRPLLARLVTAAPPGTDMDTAITTMERLGRGDVPPLPA